MSYSPSIIRRRSIAVAGALIGSLAVVSSAAAHDFWLIPNLFAFSGDSVVVNGKSGTRFPEGSPVQPTRVADAWLIGGTSRTRITELSVQDGALRLTSRPPAGQYLVAVGLTPRASRSTPAGLLRFLRAEGGAAAADRLEREHALHGMDSVTFHGASYAATVVQVGRGGGRAFSGTVGFPLEFVPLSDPVSLHTGDTLLVRVLGGGQPVSGIGVDARPAADSTVAGPAADGSSPWISLQADANGIVRIPLAKSGLWLLRSAWVGRRAGGSANEFDVARSTYVFGVMGHH